MQHTAVNLVTSSWAPSNSWKFIRSYIVSLDVMNKWKPKLLHLPFFLSLSATKMHVYNDRFWVSSTIPH